MVGKWAVQRVALRAGTMAAWKGVYWVENSAGLKVEKRAAAMAACSAVMKACPLVA